MLNKVFPFGLACHHPQVESFSDRQPSGSWWMGSKASRTHHRGPPRRHLKEDGVLPEDVIVIILGYLNVAEILMVRQCNKWLKHLTENRQFWTKFVSHPYFPRPASALPIDTLSTRALEQLVRRQHELSRTWSPRRNVTAPIAVRRSYRLPIPNNESLTAMSSMDSWVAVASDLGGVYVCAPFGSDAGQGTKWVRMVSVSVEINKLSVAVWRSSGREYVAVMWAGRIVVGPEYRCGLVVASAEDLFTAQCRASGRVVLSTSDFVLSSSIQLRNPASEVMDIALGDRYCAVVDDAHITQVFMHRTPNGEPTEPINRSQFHGRYLSPRKTITLQFLPNDQLLFRSDTFIAVYKPVAPDSSVMATKSVITSPSTLFFGLFTQRRSANVPFMSDYMSVPLLALCSNGTEVAHFDLCVPPFDTEDGLVSDYRLSHRLSTSYQLVPWIKPFSLGTINGGHSRLVWITSTGGRPFGIALGRLSVGNGDPTLSYQTQLGLTGLDLGDYGKALAKHAPSEPFFAFHEGEGKLFGGIRGIPDLFMMNY
ncbi:F-box and WD-40 domain protein [Ceratobasidium sp. AG-Ba]|nr:F-box and WD-40 domain protein [Ceratobasidium sp. AG-Ba]